MLVNDDIVPREVEIFFVCSSFTNRKHIIGFKI